MVQLPRPVHGLAAQYREPLVLKGLADANGRAVLTSPEVPARVRWQIDYITVSTSTGASSSITVYDTVEDFSRVIDGSSTLGGGGVAAYVPPRPLGTGSRLLLVWAGAGAGAGVAARIELHEELAD